MNNVKRYGIYLIRLRFLESSSQKLRPVIAVSKPHGQHKVVAIVPISSRSDQTDVDIKVKDWQQSNLIKPSVARVHRLTAVLQTDLIEELGSITSREQPGLDAALRQLLEL